MSKPATVPITLDIDAEAAAALERKEGENWKPLCASLINRLAYPIAAEQRWRRKRWEPKANKFTRAPREAQNKL